MGDPGDARFYNLPGSRLQPSGCLLPRKRHHDGGKAHAAFVDCVIGTFYPALTPWHEEFLGYQTRQNLGTGSSSAMLCREVREVLCDAAWDLQRCMVPLMHLEGDEIMEALLLGPADDRPGMSPTLEEEAVLLGG